MYASCVQTTEKEHIQTQNIHMNIRLRECGSVQ